MSFQTRAIAWLLVSRVTRFVRAGSLAVIALVAVPVLSACDTSPGAAALVGSNRITTDALQTQVNQSLEGGQLQSQSGFDQAAFTRQLLAHMINVRLLAAAAATHDVTVTQKDIDGQTAVFVKQAGSLKSLQQQAASGGVTAAQLPGFIRFAALEQKLSGALVADMTASPAQLAAEYQKNIDQFDQFEIAQIVVRSKARAEQILHSVRKHPGSFASYARSDSIDTATKSKGGLVGFVGRTALQQALGVSTPPKEGTFALAHTSSGYIVVHLISRRVQPESAVTQQLKASLFSSQAQSLLDKAISAEAARLGVHVSPRYGRWDASTDSVVAVTSPVSSSG
jgi:hypothetical protein